MRSFQLLHERPHVRERTARRFRHVLVDEYQDTNFAQGMLLRLLVEDHSNVTRGGRRRPGDLPLPRGVAEEPARVRARAARRDDDQAGAQLPLGAAHPRRGRRGRGADPGARAEEAHRRERRARALLALQLRARAGAGRRRRGRAADRRRRAARGDLRAGALGEGRGRRGGLGARGAGDPVRTLGAAAYFQRAEVRDVLAWLRALADPGDSGAVVRALSAGRRSSCARWTWRG